MARRSKSSKRPMPRRDIPITIANPRLHRLSPLTLFRPSPRTPVLIQHEDRRLFNPSRATQPARSMVRRADAKLIVPFVDNTYKAQRLPHAVQFAKPRNILICVRRKVRKEVLMAMGAGGSKVRRPKRNQFSDVRC